MINKAEFILYVKEQASSVTFYETLLNLEPVLNVPGMTEFQLSDNLKLGLMLESGIAKIITPVLVHPKEASGIPRCELYIHVDDPEVFMSRGLTANGKMISPLQKRDWGDTVGYISDLDGHVIAFAK